ncbi:MAG TPA: phospholipase D-like domain-containing protein [Candidatus Saccharibacteria bacterium]|nr:phospholipase D-like domain-containing protein [Candidatus Saccharibacteria bacterium]HMR38190.1 phospholipase D-like domain-containing protein [Candidatus Saccharibacteria bacterium]
MAITPKLIPADQYVQTVVDSIDTARVRIFVLVMILGNDESTDPLLQALKRASGRGVEVSISADSFTLSEIIKPFRPRQSKQKRPITKLKKELENAGIRFQWLGSSASSAVSGRTHSKWIIVDDTTYSFGGINLYDEAFVNTDFMFEIKNISLADSLVREQKRIIESNRRGHAYKSHSLKSDYGTILVDGGLLGDSLIYKRALALTKRAKRVWFISQYCPSGRLGLALKKTDTKLYFNDWRQASPFNAFVIRAGALVSGNHSLYKKSTYLHAKYMIFELHNGKKIAITGSHNFSNGGVWLGTREISLETTDQEIIRQLEAFTRKFVR